MTWEIFWDLAIRIGLPGAIGFGLAWAIWAGKLLPKRDLDKAEQNTTDIRKDYEARLVEQRRDYEQRLVDQRTAYDRQMATMITDWQQREAALVKDRDYFRDFTLGTMEEYERATRTTEAAVSTSEATARTAVRATSRRRS